MPSWALPEICPAPDYAEPSQPNGPNRRKRCGTVGADDRIGRHNPARPSGRSPQEPTRARPEGENGSLEKRDQFRGSGMASFHLGRCDPQLEGFGLQVGHAGLCGAEQQLDSTEELATG